MRVGFFTEVTAPIRNGVVVSVRMLAEALADRGYDVATIAPWFPGNAGEAKLVRVPSCPLPTASGYRLALPGAARRELAAALDGAAIVHAHSAFVMGAAALREARRRDVPLVFTYHTRLEAYAHYAPGPPELARRALRLLARSYADAADLVIAPSAAIASDLAEAGVRRPIAIVPTGIDAAVFARGRRNRGLRATAGAASEASLVLCAGRLAREKNLELALEAFVRLPRSSRLVFVGDGPHRAALAALAGRLGVAGRTCFLGDRPRGELPDWFASADVLAFTSTTETQGLVLVEALAAGCPVVAVACPVVREVLRERGAVAPGRADAFAEALAATLRTPPARRSLAALADLDRPAFGLAVERCYERALRGAGS